MSHFFNTTFDFKIKITRKNFLLTKNKIFANFILCPKKQLFELRNLRVTIAML